jgi:hypothetical protein
VPRQSAPAAGYSGTSLARKLGLSDGAVVHLVGPPSNYEQLIGPAFGSLKRAKTADRSVDIVHLFTASRSRLSAALAALRTKLRPDAVIWVSWPKKSSGVPSDVTEDTIRDIALPLDFVDVKVCAIDATWSGLKLMVRRECR